MTLSDRPAGLIRWDPRLPPEILQAIGKIAIVSANVEQLLHLIYWKHANLTEESGRIVTGDLGPTRLTEDIVKLVRIDKTKANILSDLNILFEEYRSLTRCRNQCVHWIWSIESETPEVKTVPGATAAPQLKLSRPIYKQRGEPEAVFDAASMETLYDDYAWLERRLMSHAIPEGTLRKQRAEIDAVGTVTMVEAPGVTKSLHFSDFFFPAPWLDKPAPLNGANNQGHGTEK